MRMRLHNLIFAGMLAGLIVGLLLWTMRPVGEPETPSDERTANVYGAAVWVLELFGTTLFIGALKMIIAPLILASIVAGVTSLPNIRELGAIGWKTLVYYLTTTSIAVVIGLVAVLLVQPGNRGASVSERERRRAELEQREAQYEAEVGSAPRDDQGHVTTGYLTWLRAIEEGSQQARESGRFQTMVVAKGRSPGGIFRDDIVKPLLMNPFQSLAADPPNALGIIGFALLLGIACTFVGEPARPVVHFFQSLNDVIMRVTHWLMSLSPIAIACIVAHLVAVTGPRVFESLGWYCGTVIGGIGVHVVVLLLIAALLGRVSPRALWRGIREAWLVAFTTRSSAATLPITIANTTEKLLVSPKVANFSLPLGATMNMDGTALYEGVAVIFLIQIYGPLDDVLIQMTPMTTFLVFVTAVLASIGAAAVPNAGLVTMVIVASAVHLPIYYIPLIFAVDAVLDMFRTSTNVLGDVIGAVVVNRMERARLGEAVA